MDAQFLLGNREVLKAVYDMTISLLNVPLLAFTHLD